MVDRHAFRSRTAKWTPLELSGAIPEGQLTKAKAGAQTLVLVRHGDTINALHDTCAHAGCSLADGKIVGSTVECSCHGSRYELATGHLRRGPSVYDQPVYEVRRSADGWEARRGDTGAG
jgi:nitrite reductase/ring-hydroxylating ferredoxin subunit